MAQDAEESHPSSCSRKVSSGSRKNELNCREVGRRLGGRDVEVLLRYCHVHVVDVCNPDGMAL